jgi:TPR repeat protein
MTDGEILDYDAEYMEAEERYIDDHYPELRCPDKDKRTVHRGDTLDEYLKLLIDGYINVELRTGLEKYLMELLEDEWFYQWPFVHWAYASRLLYKAKSDRAKKKAVEHLRPLAEAKCPGALHDMGYCYMYGVGLEYSYNKAIYHWIMASQLGYLDSQTALLEEYRYGSDYKNLPEELNKNGLTLRFRPYLGKVSSEEQRQSQMSWAVLNPKTVKTAGEEGSFLYAPAESYFTGEFHEKNLPNDIIDENGTFKLRVVNADSQ